ncbi:MAG: hypothetical protein NTY90_04515 [Candidatus Micrarchaeota archaeon]|nr:hypothetical protein [Candidatus Micrarchaeota archaeon]
MRRAAFLAVVLLFSSFSGAWFAEFSYRLPPEYPDTWYLYLLPQSCSAFEGAKIIFPKGVEEKEFSGALAEGIEANKWLAEAGKSAWWQRNFLGGDLVSRRYFYGQMSAECFAAGAEALRHAVAAAQAGLGGVDSVLKELDGLVGDGTGTSAAAVMAEAREAALLVEEKTGGEKGVGPRLVRAAGALDGVWAGFSNRTVGSGGVIAVINELAGENSLLGEEIVLARKANKAVGELVDEYAALKEDWARKSLEVKIRWGEVDAMRLWAVGETSMFFDEWTEVVGSEYGVGSFRESIGKISAAREEADRLSSLAGDKMQAKKRGYYSDAMRLLQEAAGRLDDAVAETVLLADRSAALDGKAEQKTKTAFIEAEAAADAAELSNPRASAKAREMLGAEEKKIREMNSAARGDRINFFIKEIRALGEIGKQAGGIEAVEEEKARAVEKINRVKEMVSEAEGDGLETGYESERLRAIEYAVLKAGADEESAQVLSVLGKDLDGISDGVVADAVEKYGALLEGYWERVKKMDSLLTADERLRVAGVEKFFPGGALDARAAIGSLAETRRLLEGILSRAEANAPQALKRHLEEGMAFSESVGLVRLGEKTEITAEFAARNELPLEYGGEIALSAPVLPADFVADEKSGAVRVAGGTVYVSGVAEGAEYSFKGRYYETVAETEKETEATERATEREAVKRIEIVFSSTREAKVLVEKEFGFPARFSVSSDRVFSWDSEANGGGSRVAAVVNAAKGENKVVVRYSIDEPFEASEETLGGNNSLSFRVVFRNRYVDLDGVELRYAREIACGERVAVSGLEGSARYGNGFVSAEFRVPWFQKGDEKSAEITVSCASLEAAAAAKIASVEKMMAALNDSVLFQILAGDLVAARNAFAGKDFARAIAIGDGIEEKITATGKGAGGAVEAEANKLAAACGELVQKGLAVDSAQAAIALANEALGLAGEGDDAGAWKKISDARAVLEKRASETVDDARKQGAKAGELAELAGFAALGKWAEFFGKAGEVTARIAADAAVLEKEAADKKALFADYDKQREAVAAAAAAFATAFWVPEDGGAAAARKKSLLYVEGGKRADAAQKATGKLDSAWAAMESGEFNKYSTAFIQSTIADLEAARSGLEETAGEMGDRAGEELKLAGEKQKQFGSPDTGKTLAEAEDALGENKFFYSYFLASGMERTVLGMTGEAAAAGAGDGFYWLLGAFGLAALAGLVYVFSVRKGKELKEL